MKDILKYDLEKKILAAEDAQTIVDAPFETILPTMIELGILVLLIEDTTTNTVNRIALSQTEPAAGAVRMSNKPFHEIKIPLSSEENAIVQAIKTDKNQLVTDWKYLFIPELSEQEARDNQNGAGIMCSVVSPLHYSDKRGAIIFSFLCSASDLKDEHQDFIHFYSQAVSSKF